MKEFIHYIRVWYRLALCTIKEYYAGRFGYTFFFLGKILRFSFFLILVLALFRNQQEIFGFDRTEALLVYFVFNLMDIVTQAFMRSTVQQGYIVGSGEFDQYLTKPIHTFFLVVFRHADILDLVTLPPVIGAIIYLVIQMHGITVVDVFGSIVLFINGLVVLTGVHVFVASFSNITADETDVYLVYRDLGVLHRFPMDIYARAIRFFTYYLVPISVGLYLPAQFLLGKIGVMPTILAVILSWGFLLVSRIFWRFSLSHYQSASS